MNQLLPLVLIVLGYTGTAQNIIYFSSEEASSGRDLYALNTTSDKKVKLTQKVGNGHYPHYINPKLSPDGSGLVFQADTDGHDRYAIWTMKTDGTEMIRITLNEGMYPNWSPDGKSIIFSGRRNGVWEIILIPSQGGTEEIISKNRLQGKRPGWGATCSFHPDGKSFLYSYIREKVLYSYNFTTGQIERLTNNGNYTHPIYSEDGNSIVVNRKLNNGEYEMVVIKDGGEEVISKSVVSYSAPDWYADKNKLLFVGFVNGNQELFSIDLNNRVETQLTHNNTFDAMPVAK